MRRSEMLTALTEFLDNAKYTGILQTQKPSELASSILQLVESNGMLPPVVWVDTYTNGPEERNRWEPESDHYY